MVRTRTALIVVIACLVLPCLLPEAGATPNKSPSKAPAREPVRLEEGEVGSPFYRGRLDDRIGFSMDLQRYRDSPDLAGTIRGSLRYDSSRESLDLEGTIEADGAFSFQEFHPQKPGTFRGASTGKLEGRFDKERMKGTGTWRDPDGKKTYRLTLERPWRMWGIHFPGDTIDSLGSWPVFTDPRFRKLERKFAEHVRSAVRGFQDGVAEYEKGEGEGSAEMWKFAADVVPVHVSRTLVSVRASEWEYSGGAHGNGTTRGETYMVQPDGSFEAVPLSRFFKPGASWTKRVSGRIVAGLKKQEAMWPPDGFETELEGGMDYTVDAKGFHFLFDAYTVGPYAQGDFDVFVPFSALKGLLAPDRPR